MERGLRTMGSRQQPFCLFAFLLTLYFGGWSWVTSKFSTQRDEHVGSLAHFKIDACVL